MFKKILSLFRKRKNYQVPLSYPAEWLLDIYNAPSKKILSTCNNCGANKKKLSKNNTWICSYCASDLTVGESSIGEPRGKFYAAGLQWGFLSTNDIRDFESHR